jgi:hypothetical protein
VRGHFDADFIDDCDRSARGDGLAFLADDLAKHAAHGRWNLGVYLIRGDFDERFIFFDGIARLLEPLCDGTFGDGLTELGHRNRH